MSVEKLAKKLTPPANYAKWEAYYGEKHRLDAIGISLPPEARVLELVVSWPALAVDVLDEVLNIEGFALASDAEVPKKLRSWWERNNMDTLSSQIHTEALVQGSAFIVIGALDDKTPRFTGHTAKEIVVETDSTGEVSEALQKYRSGGKDYLAHYTPGMVSYYEGTRYGNRLIGTGETNTKHIPVVPVVNKGQLKSKGTKGVSEMKSIVGYTDAASRSITNLQVAQEILAMPQRYLFGDGLETLRGPDGKPKTKIEAYMGLLWTGPSGSSAGQLPGADLSQIINSVKMYAQMVSSVAGIPPSFLGISTDNPASAEAMRAAKERLITKAERKQSAFGDSWEKAMRIALEMFGHPIDTADTLEALWRDPATPSQSAKAANLLQAQAQGIITAKTAREGLPLTPEQRAYEDAQNAGGGELFKEVFG